MPDFKTTTEQRCVCVGVCVHTQGQQFVATVTLHDLWENTCCSGIHG